MRNLANTDIRRMARCNDVPQWKIAAVLGISEPTLCGWLRRELSPERKNAIVGAIQAVAKEAESA